MAKKALTDTAAEATSPTGRLAHEVRNVLGATGGRVLSSIGDRLGAATGRLTEYADKGGGPGLVAAFTANKLGKKAAKAVGDTVAQGAESLGKAVAGDGAKKLKVTNIVESIDIGVPVGVAYDQWTRFTDFPTFMKKVEHVEQESPEELTWQAQVFWSHRKWKSTITEQVPDERIVWRSEGDKGYVDGAVTFHELSPSLARIIVVLEYHPRGFFEHVGNMWRAQGRRVRLELKHFARHVMTESILHPDEIEGWRGEIHDGQVTEPKAAEQRGRRTEEEPEDRSERRPAGRAAERTGRRAGQEERRRTPDRPPRRDPEGRPTEQQRAGGTT